LIVSFGAPQKDSTETNHVALMDKVYRRQRHIYDFTRKYYLLGRDRLIRELAARPNENIVEIGCGTARNLIGISKAYPEARLFGLDASHEMLRSAEESINRAGLGQKITLAHGLAEDMTPELFGMKDKFDRAIFSYSLSMIPDWRGALRTAAENVRPGGTIHIVDFGDLEGLWPPVGRAIRAWLRLFHVAPRDALLKGLEEARDRTLSFHVLPGRYAFVITAHPKAFSEFDS
jgi:S-adenosylmethionine-diacylgycerolhomoserine-N-methlytransferase